MNDVLSTIAVIAIIGLGTYIGFGWGVMFMDTGPTRGFWIGEVIIALLTCAAVYAIIHWAMTT